MFQKCKNGPVDYSIYHLTVYDRLKYGLFGMALAFAVSMVFYRNLQLFLVAGPLAAFLLPVFMKNALKEQRTVRLREQFREAIGILGGYLGAGFSVGNSFGSSIAQLERLYGEKAEITLEFSRICNGIRMNEPVETLLRDFAARSGDPDIQNFAEVFAIAGKTGGDLMEITDRTVSVIREKMSVAEEIRNLTAQKRFEQRIMYAVPFLLIIYLNVSSPGFLDVLYETWTGRTVMTLCLITLTVSFLISRKILDIRV